MTIKGKLIIIEINVSDSEALLEIPEMFIQVRGRVVAKRPPEYRPVTITAGIRATSAGNAAGVGGIGIIENWQTVSLGVSGKLFIGRKGQFIQLDSLLAVACKIYLSGARAIDQTR